MLRQARLSQAKGVLAQLMQQAYRWRDRVALVGFSGQGSQLLIRPRRARPDASDWLAPLGGGGGTPLGAALQQADALLQQHPGPGWLWLLTDGRSRETPARPVHAQQIYLLDFDTARPPLSRAPALADAWGAQWLHADALSAG